MSHIFISYSRKDIDFAGKIVQALAEENLDTWIDWKSIPKGEEWEQEIYDGIEAADAFLFLISPDSVRSEMCNKEIAHAVNNGKRILPILIQDTGTEIIPKDVSKINWIFFRDGQDNFEKAIDEIRETVNTDYDWLKFHTELLVKARRWEHRNFERSLLLRGKDLEEAESLLSSKSGIEPNPIDLQRRFVLQSRQAMDRQRRVLTYSLIVIAVVMLGLAVWGQGNALRATNQASTAQAEADARATAETEADERAKISRAGELAALSNSILDSHYDRAMLLSVEAYHMFDNYLTRGALLNNIQANPQLDGQKQTFGMVISGFDNWVTAVAFSPDGKILVICENDGSVTFWSTQTWQLIDIPRKFHTERIMGLAFNPKGDILASAGDDGTINLWDVVNRKSVDQLSLMPGQKAYSVAFSPDGKTLASGYEDGTIILWDMVTQQVIVQIKQHNDSVSSISFDPTGKVIASGGFDNQVFLWRFDGNQLVGNSLNGHDFYVTSVAFSPDGKKLASVSFDDNIILWDINTGQAVIQPLPKEIGFIYSVVFSPDGKMMATGSLTSNVNLWDVQSLQPIGEALVGHTDEIWSVAFSLDGKMLASGSIDKSVIIWSVEPDVWVQEDCQRAGRNFTHSEWAFYFPDETYRATCPQWPLESEINSSP